MLVHYDGSRVKLAAEYAQQEVENSTQGQIQPLNQQAKPVLPKNTQPAAGQQHAAPAAQPMTPKIRNPTLERMGIQMPDPKPATVTSTKLSKLAQAINNARDFRAMAEGRAPDYIRTNNFDPLLVQTLKHRDFYDSPYLTTNQATDLKLRAPQKSRQKSYEGHLRGGIGAFAGGMLPLMGYGFTPQGIGLAALGAGAGYLGGRLSSNNAVKNKLTAYRYHLNSQN